MKWNIHHRFNELPHHVVPRIARQPDNLNRIPLGVGPFERLANRILAVEEDVGKCLVHNRYTRVDIALSEVSPVEQRNLHRLQPSRGNVEEKCQRLPRSPSAKRKKVVRLRPAQQRPRRQRHRLDPRNRAHTVRYLVPSRRRLPIRRYSLQPPKPFRRTPPPPPRPPPQRRHKPPPPAT